MTYKKGGIAFVMVPLILIIVGGTVYLAFTSHEITETVTIVDKTEGGMFTNIIIYDGNRSYDICGDVNYFDLGYGDNVTITATRNKVGGDSCWRVER